MQGELPWIALAAKHFIDRCGQRGCIPYLARLSPYLRLALEGMEPRICMTLSEAIRDFPLAALCILPDVASALPHLLPLYAPKAALVAAPLLARQSAHRLLSEITMANLLTRLPDNKVWMQFSGGTSLVRLSNEHASQLSMHDLEQSGDCWLQRVGRSRFKVWQSGNPDATLSACGINNIVEIDWPRPVISTRLQALLGSDTPGDTQRSVNPESFYRSLYWTYAAKLISRMQVAVPIVLLIAAEEEMDKVAGLFRSRGYYVPERKAGLRRKLELLANAGKKPALLPLPFTQLTEVLQCRFDTPFQFVRESLSLGESALLTPQAEEEHHEPSDRADEDWPEHKNEAGKDDESEALPALKKQNVFAGLHRELSLVQHQASAIAALNPANSFTLLDPRIGDYPRLNERYSISTQRCTMWEREEDYKRDLTNAEIFFRDGSHRERNSSLQHHRSGRTSEANFPGGEG